jgi:RNA polymerase sigma factor (sigma-70 family)
VTIRPRVNSSHAAEIERIYRMRLNEFVSLANAILHDEQAARDAVQDAFASALRRQPSFRHSDLEGWLWRIVLNAARSARRRKLRSGERERREDTALFVSPAEASDAPELRDVLASLPERQRAAVFLRYYADLDYQTIATALNVRPGTVAAALHSAHAALRRDLKKEVAT